MHTLLVAGVHPTVKVPFLPSWGATVSGVPVGPFNVIDVDTVVSTVIAMAVVILVGTAVALSARSSVPGKLQVLFEDLTNQIREMVRTSVHFEGADFVVPLALTLGVFILIANWIELIPSNDRLVSPTADWNLTLGMALVVIILVQGYSIREQGVRGYLRRFTKPFELPVFARAVFLPLNVLEEVVKPVTLSLRLLGNIFAGGVMIGLLAAMIGFGLDQLSHGPAGGATVVLAGIGNVVWKLFDMFIGLLQALIFALLTIFYFGMAREGLEEHH